LLIIIKKTIGNTPIADPVSIPASNNNKYGTDNPTI